MKAGRRGRGSVNRDKLRVALRALRGEGLFEIPIGAHGVEYLGRSAHRAACV